MKKLTCYFAMFMLFVLITATPPTDAQEKLTVAWAQWDPANYLTELSKDFTAETGIEVDVVQISWSHFQDQVFTAFVGKSDRYDIVIGDSQWLGRNSVGGHYVELTDWINANIDVASIYATAMEAFAEYPKGSGNYWALPAEVDANGFLYRTDLFEDAGRKSSVQSQIWL